MKHEKWISRLIAVVMAFTLAFAGISCVVTGFGLNVDLGDLAFNLLIAALLVAAADLYRWGNWVLLGLVALFVNHLYYRQGLVDSLESLLYMITFQYDSAYQCGVVHFGETPPLYLEPALALHVLGIPVVWMIGWTILRRKPALLAVPVAVALPAMCFIITNSVPAIWCLFLLFAGLTLLMLTQTTRRRSALDGNRLTAMLLIPALLCTSLLFWVVPQDGYLPQTETPQWLLDLFEGQGISVSGNRNTSTVDLSSVGPKWNARSEVMRVKATQKGVIYLRGQAYDHYDGLTWSVSEVDTTQDKYWPVKAMEEIGTVRITTVAPKTLRYVPYYADTAILKGITTGRLEGEATKEYSYTVYDRTGTSNMGTGLSRDTIVEQCLQLPASTEEQAKAIVKTLSIGGGYTGWAKAQEIGKYLVNLKPYDTQTAAMPEGEEDFAMWFLTEAESGYCVHFATAAVILLRAAGVPARYVTGYMLDVGDGYAVVEERHAHAWVEYLDKNRGWVVLDATPAVDEPPVTNPTNPTESVPTETTEPTEPTETTAPTESTEPPVSDPTKQTDPIDPTDPGRDPGEEPEKPQNSTIQWDLSWLWPFLLYVLPALAVIGLTAGQYYLRLYLRKRKRSKASVNEGALMDWKKVNRLSRLLKQEVPEELEELAEKAKFSQYILTDAECDAFCQKIAQLNELLRKKNWVSRFVLKLVFALE